MANFNYVVPQSSQYQVRLHFETDVPICDLNLKPSQKARLTRVKAIYMAWLQNPYINPLEMSRAMLKAGNTTTAKFVDAGDLVTAAKKDVVWFEWVLDHFLKLPSRKVLQYRGLRTAERVITAGLETGNDRAVIEGLKQQYKYGGLDQPEEDPQHINEASFTELIPTTDVTKVDPTRQRITEERRLELAKKWGAHIDEHGVLIDSDGKPVIQAEAQTDTEETEE